MRHFFRRLRLILNVRRFIPFLYDFFTSREVLVSHKLFSLLMLFGYTLFPFDLVPDFLFFFGFLDDLFIISLIFQQIIKMAPRTLQEKYFDFFGTLK